MGDAPGEKEDEGEREGEETEEGRVESLPPEKGGAEEEIVGAEEREERKVGEARF